MAGDKRWVSDPRVAANWLIGSSRMQLQRQYGVMREAMRLAKAEYRKQRGEGSSAPVTCIECGTDQPPVGAEHWNFVNTETFAQEHPDKWSKALTPVRRRNLYSSRKEAYSTS